MNILAAVKWLVVEVKRLRAKVDTMSGDGVTNHPTAITIHNRNRRRDRGGADSPRETISFFITGNASGNGKYTAKSFTDVSADVAASGTLATSDVGTLASANDCLVLNLIELGSSTTGHDVTAATNTAQFSLYGTGRLVRINSDGTKVIHANIFFAGCT